ncbi:MAG: FKBP-type peptidyl-prolyl cis-trans isomerase [Bacteroidia bacterium]
MKALKFLSVIMLSASVALAQTAIKSKPVKNPKPVKTASGLEYTITSKGNGKKPVAGDKVKVHYTGTLLDGTKFDSSVDRGQPFSFELGKGAVIKGWDEGIALLNVGDKATLVIPAELGYGAQANGKIPANSVLKFDVELLDIVAAPKPWDITGKKVEKTASGLGYVILSKGKSQKKAAKGDKVKVHYSGYFTDGKKFDSSVERGEPIEFQVGKGQVIPGWDEGLLLLNVGDKAKLIIPYNLAYGEQGRGPIPAKADLIFDVELIDVKETVKPVAFNIEGKDVLETASGLKYIVVQKGTGKEAQVGSKVKVHYTGYLENGDIFDSSVERGQPFEFPLGQGQVIKGWDEGVALMQAGGKYRLIIPYELAYGEKGYGPIPPKAKLVFDVELLEVN